MAGRGVRKRYLWFGLTAGISLLVYGLTAFPTITWWDASEYITAAYTLGVPHPPGSLLLVLSGWLFTRLLPWVAPAALLNTLAGAFAAGTVLGAGRIGYRLLKSTPAEHLEVYSGRSQWLTGAALFAGMLIFAFSRTLWSYAVRFTPYVLTGLFTALLMWALLRWWEEAETRQGVNWLFVIALFFGLDFAVHRTNWLLLPGLLPWVLLRRPKTLLSPRAWGAGLGGLAAGLSVLLLLIPMATGDPLLNFTNPATFQRLRDYLAISQYGGGMMINLFPRQGSFWPYQVMDYLRVFGQNFFSWGYPLRFIGLLPAVLGITGIAVVWKRRWRLGCGLTLLFLLSSLGAVFYFNLPADYFRSIDRHYLPSFVIFGTWIIYGAGFLMRRTLRLPHKQRNVGVGLVLTLLFLVTLNQVLGNYRQTDGSRHYFAYDYAHNLLTSLPDKAIFFVAGDANTYPVWYLQYVEGIRTDVTVCNLHLLNTPWYLREILARDSEFPLTLTSRQIHALRVITWQDSTIALPDPARAGREPSGAVTVQVPPTLGDSLLYVHDQILLKVFTENAWRRPIYFTRPEFAATWIRPYLRQEGIVYRLLPQQDPPIDIDILRKNVLTRYRYRGYADPEVHIDAPTYMPIRRYYDIFLLLGEAERQIGHREAYDRVMHRMMETLPPQRLHPPDQVLRAIQAWKSGRE